MILAAPVYALVAVLACSNENDPLRFTPSTSTAPTLAASTTPKPPPTSTKTLAPPKATSPIGTNLAEVREYSSEFPFADLMKQSRTWISTSGTTWDDGKPLALDERGWVKSLAPGQKARALLAWGDGLRVPKGTYRLTATGKGKLNLWPQGGVVDVDGAVSVDVDVDPARGGVAITIDATDPESPVRDIALRLPGVAPTDAFNPAFVARLKGFETLRFMDWLDTNHSSLSLPGDRPTPADARYTVKGVPAEVIGALCAAANADAWVNVGHTWGDDLVRAFATALRESLPKDRRVYVEHSNEVWNGIFPQANAMKSTGLAAGLAKDPFEAQLRAHAKRSAEVHAIFEEVFGADKSRIVRVVGGWASNAWSSGILLDQIKKQGAVVDAVAIAPYFGGSFGEPARRGEVQSLGLPEFMKNLESAVDEAIGWTKAQREVATKWGVALVAYEGGQHLVGVGPVVDDAVVNRLFDAANRDPAMKALYLRYLQGWKAAGGGLFLHFTSTYRPTKYGRWGAAETLEQTRAEAPKLDALLTFQETTPRWW